MTTYLRSILCVLTLLFISHAPAAVIDREGSGFLELKDSSYILHLKGSPYERGYQHGRLLKTMIQRNISTFIDKKQTAVDERTQKFIENLPTLMKYIPSHFLEEMKGVSDGSGIAMDKILLLNLFPEMFHCSGMTLSGPATKDHQLYHVRVLDYSIGKNLQDTAVLMAVEPQNGHSYLNVSYAGFIGSITGMNKEKIAIGEIGGLGYGYWDGIPMAFLLREILEKAGSLEEAKQILASSPRTCEYYYVISDGKTNEGIGVYATASQLRFILPGSSYALLAPSDLPENYGAKGEHDKFLLTACCIENTPHQTLLFQDDKNLALLFRQQPTDCVLLTGFSTPARYPVMTDRILQNWGKIDQKTLIEVIKTPVALPTNLHNAIFLPAELKVWISHAGPNNEPACNQPYVEFSLLELFAPSS